jgi:hypothetical protein
MNSINEAVRKGPLMTMTLECETEFPKALKDLMVAMGIHGAAVYKGFPVMDEGVEYWWVQLHLYKNKEDNHKDSGFCMVTNSVMHTTFFDSARDAAWKAIKELGDRIKCRMLNTQNDLREEKKHTQELEDTNQRLREDIIDLAMESCDQDRQIASRDALIANLASEWGL